LIVENITYCFKKWRLGPTWYRI